MLSTTKDIGGPLSTVTGIGGGIGVPASGGGGYTGPLDLVPGAVVAYGQRALSAAKRGSALMTLKRNSDNAEQVFNSDATTGAAPIAAIQAFTPATFTQTGNVQSGNDIVTLVDATGVTRGMQVTGSDIPAETFVADLGAPIIQLSRQATGTNAAEVLTFHPFPVVDTYNDQSGNGADLGYNDVTQYPGWHVRADNGLPIISRGDAGGYLQSASGTFLWATGDPFTAMCVFGYSLVSNSSQIFFPQNNAGTHSLDMFCGPSDFNTDQDNSVNFGRWTANSIPSLGLNLHIFEQTYDASGNTSILIDGVAVAITGSGDVPFPLPSTTPDGFIFIGFNMFPGGSPEICIWRSVVSAPNRLAVRQNMAAYYGIAL